MTNEFIVNNISLDWITATTFDRFQQNKMSVLSNRLGHAERNGSMENYRGTHYAHGFYGIGIQKDKRNDMLVVSGRLADDIWPELDCVKCNLSRVDVQLTLEKPADYNHMKLAEFIRDNAKYSPKVLPMGGFEGSTIYIGSEKSDKRIRVYEKGDEFSFLRLEVQLRRKKAREFRYNQNLRGLKLAKEQVLSEALHSLGEAVHPSLSSFYNSIGSMSRAKKLSVNETDVNRRMWVLNSLKGMVRYAHEGSEEKSFVLRALEMAQKDLQQ